MSNLQILHYNPGYCVTLFPHIARCFYSFTLRGWVSFLLYNPAFCVLPYNNETLDRVFGAITIQNEWCENTQSQYPMIIVETTPVCLALGSIFHNVDWSP